jgi:drug/metabolite transporter (DMT)-like permease
LSNLLKSPYLLLSMSSLLWAGNAVVGRGLREEIPPMTFGFLRWVVGMGVLLPFALPHVLKEWPTIRAAWKPLLLMGVLGTAIHNSLQYQGLQTTTATNVVLLNACIPMIVIVLSWLFLRQHLSARQALGVALSLAGVVIIVIRADASALRTLSFVVGDLWALAGITCWAIYTLCLRWRPPTLHPLAFLLTIGVIGLAVIAPLALAELLQDRAPHASLRTAGGLIYTGLGPTLLAFICWNQGVKLIGASKASLFLHLMPVFGALLSIVFLGERLHLYHLVGIVLIFSGIYFTTRPRVAAATRAT